MENINGGFMMNFILSLQFIFKPHYWLMNNSYNKEWDEKLNQLMDKYPIEFGPVNSLDGEIHTITLGGNLIWIANYPYAYASPYSYTRSIDDVRPSRLTIQRLHNLVKSTNVPLKNDVEPLIEYLKNVDKSLDEKHK